MPETVDMLRYIEHLRRRWRLVAVACGAAVGGAWMVALLTPAQYTATARVIIEPPAGSDARVAVAVSPVYLESLKSYELVASGDRLFLDAIEHFKLPRSGPVEAMKRSVLKVRIPRNTKILEISATLRDPVQAQALALYIAQQTAKTARDVSLDLEREQISDTRTQLSEAGGRVEQAEPRAGKEAGRMAEKGAQGAPARAERQALEAAEKRPEETLSTGPPGERLRIVDPGVVPESRSWPNTPLIVLAALLVALTASLLYLALELNYVLERSAAPRSVAPMVRAKTGND